MTITPEPTNLCSLVKETVEELSSIHGDRFRLREPEAIHGVWDQAGLRRLLENLVTNAVKYGTPGKDITVSLDDQGEQISLSVHNHGEPIPVAQRDKMFEYLHRASGAEASGKTGWGIGLTLVRGVAEAHGGKVSVQSEQGAGTTFRVTLPKDLNSLST